jgi:hypothetical protein
MRRRLLNLLLQLLIVGTNRLLSQGILEKRKIDWSRQNHHAIPMMLIDPILILICMEQ